MTLFTSSTTKNFLGHFFFVFIIVLLLVVHQMDQHWSPNETRTHLNRFKLLLILLHFTNMVNENILFFVCFRILCVVICVCVFVCVCSTLSLLLFKLSLLLSALFVAFIVKHTITKKETNGDMCLSTKQIVTRYGFYSYQ